MADQKPAGDTSRFLAPPPVIVPKGASRQKQLELGFPAVPPLQGTKLRREYDRLVGLGKRLFGQGSNAPAKPSPRRSDPRFKPPGS